MNTGEPQPQSPSPQPDAPARTLRVPVGYVFVAAGVLVLLLATSYGIGFNRGEHSGRQLRAQDQQEVLERQTRMSAVSEVSEPGGALAPVPNSIPESTRTELGSGFRDVRSSATEANPPSAPVSALVDQREVGLNYYVIDHPSQAKAEQLVAFCLDNGLQARLTTTLGGGAKVYVLPGFGAGEGRNPEIMRLLDQIREVGIRWKRLAPRQNSDFSTRYAEKYKGPPSNG